MQIAGVQTISLIDYPGKVCTTLFTLGCNFRCPYCHNKQISFDFADVELMDEEAVFKLLDERKDFIDAISISGGEPTLQPDILDFCKKIKDRYGLLIKFDTNGSFPTVLKRAIDEKLVDYVALDIKTSFTRYKEHLGVEGEIIYKSYNIIKDSGIDYELRMTCFPEFIHTDSITEVMPLLSPKDRVFIQQCILRSTNEAGEQEEAPLYTEEQLELFGNMFTSLGFSSTSIRSQKAS